MAQKIDFVCVSTFIIKEIIIIVHVHVLLFNNNDSDHNYTKRHTDRMLKLTSCLLTANQKLQFVYIYTAHIVQNTV